VNHPRGQSLTLEILKISCNKSGTSLWDLPLMFPNHRIIPSSDASFGSWSPRYNGTLNIDEAR
jgi:hypothetical protein